MVRAQPPAGPGVNSTGSTPDSSPSSLLGGRPGPLNVWPLAHSLTVPRDRTFSSEGPGSSAQSTGDLAPVRAGWGGSAPGDEPGLHGTRPEGHGEPHADPRAQRGPAAGLRTGLAPLRAPPRPPLATPPPGATSLQGPTVLGPSRPQVHGRCPPFLDGIRGSIGTSPPARSSRLHLEDVAVSSTGPSARVEVVAAICPNPRSLHTGVAGRPV